VASNPAGIACTVTAAATSGTCAASFDEGTVVRLTATPAAGSSFGGWSGACTGTGTCQVTMSAALSVEARFDLLPVLEVTPTSLTFAAQEGTDPASQTVTVTNGGGGTLDWAVTDDQAWLSAAPASGSLAGGASATVTVSVAGAGLAPDVYAGTDTVCGAGVGRDVAVEYTVTATPTQTLTVTGAGAGTGSVDSNPAAITCTSTAGVTSGACAAEFDEGTPVTLTATPAAGSSFGGWSGACTGTGTCEVTLDAARSVEAAFELLPTLEVTPTSLTFAAQEGTDPASQTLAVTNGGGGTLDWTASATSGDPAWLGVAPASGSLEAGQSATLTVSVASAGLSPGDYAGTLTVSGAGDSRDVVVDLAVTATPTRTLTVTGAGAGAGSVASDPVGVTCAVDAGTTSGACAADFDEGTPVSLTATPAAGSSFGGWSGACTGTGTCEVTLDAARSVEAAFDLLPTLEVTPTSLTYAADEGTDPASQILTVTNGGGGTLAWVVTEDAAWLSAAPASGSLTAGQSATVTVSVASAALAAGDYADTMTVSGAGASQDVSVDLAVTAGNAAPTASFGVDCTGLTCDFTDTSSDSDGAVVAWSWEFGDGATASVQNPQHTYATGGPRTITLVVTDDDALDSDPAEESVSLSTPVQAGYQVEIRLSPGVSLTSSQRAAVESAVARWEAVITADLPQVPTALPSLTCGGATVPALDETVDDLVIYLQFEPIDGPGGILGQAGPCFVRLPGFLPFLGGMRFDTADLAFLEAQGRLEDVILHEMGHVLGFGTVWDDLGLIQDPTGVAPAPIQDTHFDGPLAIAAFDDVSDPDYTAGSKVPVENDNTVYGSGSLNGHWREGIFGAELMTPSLNFGSNPLSLVTIESLHDAGYQVDEGVADPFSLSFSLVAGGQPEPVEVRLDGDIWPGPVRAVDASGRVVGTLRP
jgi:PKD repeat protein